MKITHKKQALVKFTTIALLTSSLCAGQVAAQAETVIVEPEVYIKAKDDTNASLQSAPRYEILDAVSYKVIWSSNQSEALALEPGNYILRLYDVEGYALNKIEQSIVSPTQADRDANKKLEALVTTGEFKEVDGQAVFEVLFKVTVSEDLMDETGRMVSELDLYFDQTVGTSPASESEEGSASDNESAASGESQATLPSKNAVVEMGKITFQILDEKEVGIAGVNVTLGDQTLLTDQAGNAIFELPVGTYSLGISQLPEGYQLPVLESEIGITADQEMLYPINLSTQSTPSATSSQSSVSQGKLTVQILDELDKPVVGAVVTVGNQKLTSDTNGNTVFELPAGEYKLAIGQLPAGYQLPSLEEYIRIEADSDFTFPVNLIKDQTTSDISSSVSTTSQQDNKKVLPQTGEKASWITITIAAILAILGVIFLRKRNNKTK